MPFDVAILFPNSMRVALESWLSGIPRRVGYRGHLRSWLVNQIVREPRKPGPPEHHSLRFLRIARECGAETPNIEVPDPKQTSNTKHQTLIGLCPGAEYGPAKRWPTQYFAELARQLRDAGYQIWVIGSNKDHALGAAIALESGGAAVDLTGRTNLEQAVDLLSCARHVVSNDSGLMHVAAALGASVLALYGSSSPAFTPPLSERAQVLKLDLPCSPCYQRECPLGHFNCMRQLTPRQVGEALALMQPSLHEAAR